MCKQKEIKKMVPIQRALWDFFSAIDFGKKFGGMQKLRRSTHKIILRISTLIKIHTNNIGSCYSYIVYLEKMEPRKFLWLKILFVISTNPQKNFLKRR